MAASAIILEIQTVQAPYVRGCCNVLRRICTRVLVIAREDMHQSTGYRKGGYAPEYWSSPRENMHQSTGHRQGGNNGTCWVSSVSNERDFVFQSHQLRQQKRQDNMNRRRPG